VPLQAYQIDPPQHDAHYYSSPLLNLTPDFHTTGRNFKGGPAIPRRLLSTSSSKPNVKPRKNNKSHGPDKKLTGVNNRATAARIRILIEKGDLRAIPDEVKAMKVAGVKPNIRVSQTPKSMTKLRTFFACVSFENFEMENMSWLKFSND